MISLVVNYFVLFFFPRVVFYEIWDKIESVPENFPTYPWYQEVQQFAEPPGLQEARRTVAPPGGEHHYENKTTTQ